MAMVTRRLQTYALTQKINYLNDFAVAQQDGRPQGQSANAFAKHNNIRATTFRDWVRDEEVLREKLRNRPNCGKKRRIHETGLGEFQ